MGMIIVIAGAVMACACLLAIGIYCYKNLVKKSVLPAPGNSAGTVALGDEIDLEDNMEVDRERFQES